VTTHGHINKKTQCPGQFFALGPVQRYLSEAGGETAPALASRPRAVPNERIPRENANSRSEQLNRSRIRTDGYNKPITYRASVR